MSSIKKVILSMTMAMTSYAVHANIELLSRPAMQSHLATKSVATSLFKTNEYVLAVGERGHVIRWDNAEQWQQDKVPVSVLLTSISRLSEGASIAVGHDAAIIKAEKDSLQWNKVFDGYQLAQLKAKMLEQQMAELNAVIAKTEDEDELEELEYQLEELSFSLEDTQAEQESRPNKPLLGIAVTSTDIVFAVGAYGTLLRSDDKGQTWQLQDNLLDNPDKLHLNDITYINGSLYIVGESGLGFASHDQGDSWEMMDLPYAGSIFGITGQPNTDSLVAYGLQGNVMYSNDKGVTWQSLTMGTKASFLGGTTTVAGDTFLVGHGGLVAHFNIATPNQLTLKKHPSGSAFSSVIHQGKSPENLHQLVLAGQFGLVAWQYQ